jgi:four helix bundle protein
MGQKSGAVRSFEDLDVFKRAYRISLEVHKVSLQFPQIEQRALGDQIRRASKSICANIAEGFGKQRQSRAEFRRFAMMAMGSADEMRVWLRYALDLRYIDEEQWKVWRDEYQQIARMLQGLVTKTRTNVAPSDP